MVKGIIKDLPHRNIPKATTEKFDYQTAKLDGRVVELAFYRRDGEVVGQKVRYTDQKDFYSRGSMKGVELWGQHLWEPGERLVITEGEIDAMSVSAIQDNRWPVVSIPSGSTNAASAIKRNFEWVSQFKTIVLCFDMDEPGRKAASEVASLFPPGKVKIAELPLKDANDMLRAGRGGELKSCLWNAQSFRMDGIIHASEVQWPNEDEFEIYDYPWDTLNEYLIGCHPGEITLWTSGTGSGKSTALREIAAHHLKMGRSVGMVMLEESPHETVDDLVSLDLGIPVRRIRMQQKMNKLRRQQGKEPLPIANEFSQQEYEDAKQRLFQQRIFIHNHRGSRDSQSLLARLEYMVVGLGCNVVMLDHITFAVTEMLSEEQANERIVIDKLMNNMRSLAERNRAHFDVVCQLKKTDKAFEEGDRITLQDLKGAASLQSVPNQVLALERNGHDPNPIRANTTIIRCLKDRVTGRRGPAAAVRYDFETGRMMEAPFTQDAAGEIMFGPAEDTSAVKPEDTTHGREQPVEPAERPAAGSPS